MNDSKQAYDQWHNQHDVDVDANAIWHSKIKELSDPYQDFQGKKILEIGCGRGGFACWLSSQKFAPDLIVAADYSSSAIQKASEFAKMHGITNISWIEADIQSIPFEKESFDTVISCETIEHVPNPVLAVQELARVLKPGGTLYLTTPNYFNFFGIYRGYKRLIGKPFQEAGQPINNFVMLPLTLLWVKKTGLSVSKYGSMDIIIPRFKKHPKHISMPNILNSISKWLGIQSYIVAKKPLNENHNT